MSDPEDVLRGISRGERLLRRRFPARPEKLSEIRKAVLEAARGCGCGSGCATDVVLAVDEACQNVIRHAYAGNPDGEVVLEMARDGDQLVVYLLDFAPPVDPHAVRPRELDDLRPGGLGTHFIREVMDESEFLPPPSGKGNLFRMAKKIG